MAESCGGGLATAAFLPFLVRLCDKRQAATLYALLTALYALPRPLLAALGDRVADLWGYPTFFTCTFLLAVPAYCLLPSVYRWIGPNGHRGAAAEVVDGQGVAGDGSNRAPADSGGEAGAATSGRRPASAAVR